MKDFIAELTSIKLESEVCDRWTIYVNKSSNDKECGDGMLLLRPERMRFKYALMFNFRISNNEVEYVAKGYLGLLGASRNIVEVLGSSHEEHNSTMQWPLAYVRVLG